MKIEKTKKETTEWAASDDVLLGKCGNALCNAMTKNASGMHLAQVLTLNTEYCIYTVKSCIDAMVLSMEQTFGLGETVSIIYDILDDGSFGLVGKAYLRAPNVRRVAVGYDIDTSEPKPVGMTIEAVVAIMGRRRTAGRVIAEDIWGIEIPSNRTIADIAKALC